MHGNIVPLGKAQMNELHAQWRFCVNSSPINVAVSLFGVDFYPTPSQSTMCMRTLLPRFSIMVTPFLKVFC